MRYVILVSGFFYLAWYFYGSFMLLDISAIHFFVVGWYSTIWVYCILKKYILQLIGIWVSSVGLFWAKLARNIHYNSLCESGHLSPEKWKHILLWNCQVMGWKLLSCFPKCLYHYIFLPVRDVMWRVLFLHILVLTSDILLTIGIFCFGFNFHSLNDEWCLVLCVLSPLYIFYMYLQIFCQLLKSWIICFIIEL